MPAYDAQWADRRRPQRVAVGNPQARPLRPWQEPHRNRRYAAVVADATAPAVEDVIDAAFAGRPAESETGFAKARSGGVTAATIALARIAPGAMLHRLRLAVESGTSVAATLWTASPMLHFSRKAADAGGIDNCGTRSASRA